MNNDVALLRLATPLSFNRWVKPICLPAPNRVTFAGDVNWQLGPRPGTICTAVGWGALRESGPDRKCYVVICWNFIALLTPQSLFSAVADHLRVVNVPILEMCNHRRDVEGNEICAGYPKGGRDACQGDSGGPFFCQSESNSHQFYLAGIVSHGEGCAREDEPGVYTRVALFVDWILKIESGNSEIGHRQITQSNCPGFRCDWDTRCITSKQRCNGKVSHRHSCILM